MSSGQAPEVYSDATLFPYLTHLTWVNKILEQPLRNLTKESIEEEVDKFKIVEKQYWNVLKCFGVSALHGSECGFCDLFLHSFPLQFPFPLFLACIKWCCTDGITAGGETPGHGTIFTTHFWVGTNRNESRNSHRFNVQIYERNSLRLRLTWFFFFWLIENIRLRTAVLQSFFCYHSNNTNNYHKYCIYLCSPIYTHN